MSKLYKFIGNRLYILKSNGNYIRIKQKLPEQLDCITDLQNYDIDFKKSHKYKKSFSNSPFKNKDIFKNILYTNKK